jgi:parvulin-like peptidyl-prolyl isomerase
MQLKTILKEPLLHFLLIGAVLFAFYAWSGGKSGFGNERIVVTSAQIEQLAAAYAKAWARPPTEAELKGLIDDHVREEIAVREAVAAGLDRDDTIIRRRLRQKFEVIAEEQDVLGAPTDADLAAYLAKHADRFTPPATVSFEQIVLDASGTATDGERAASLAKTALQQGAAPAKLGRASMLPGIVNSTRLDLIAREFGATFADQLAKLPPNEWSGPVRSAFGVHLVRLTGYAPGSLPPLEIVRTAVAREWENERRAATRAESYRKLRDHYDVVIEAAPAPSVAAR